MLAAGGNPGPLKPTGDAGTVAVDIGAGETGDDADGVYGGVKPFVDPALSGTEGGSGEP